MAEVDPVVLQLRAELDQYLSALKHSTRTVDQQLGLQEKRAAAFERRLSALYGRVGAALGGVVTLATAREMLRLVDAGKQVEAQLRLATRESGDFAQAQEDVRRIASTTRSGLEETASLYSVFQRDSVALGISQLEAARATETLAKSFLISGANAVETAQSTRQLIQGLQSGTLRGDEFNSVMEAAPRLQKLFAQALGVSKGELRALAEDGKITAAALVDALTDTKFTKGIDAEFRELPVTFDQAMQQVRNAAIITFGAFDRGGGFSQALATFILDGTTGFADLEQAALETGIDIRSTFEGLADVFQPMLDGARAVFGEIGSEAKSLSDQVSGTLGEIDSIINFLDSQRSPSEEWIDKNIWGRSGGSDLRGTFDSGQAAAEKLRRDELAVQRYLDSNLYRRFDMLGNPIAPSTPSGGGGSSSTKRSGPSAETLAARAERERLAAIRAEGSKQQDLLRLQDDLLAARSALATASQDMLQFELQRLGVEQAGRLAELWTQKRIGELTEEEYRVRASAVAEEIGLARELARRNAAETAKTDRIEAEGEQVRRSADQLALQSDALHAQADIADTLERRRFLEASALAIQQEIERALLEQAIKEGQIADASAARLLLAERQVAETEGLERSNQGPIGRYLQSLSDTDTRVEEAVVRKLEDVDDAIADAIAKQTGINDPLIRDLLSIFIEDTLIRPILETLQKARAQGGGGGLLNSILSAVGLAAGGGKTPMPGGLKGFASGGSMMIGGRGGVDNNVLSLNDRPVARVSYGERLNIVPNQALARGTQSGGVALVKLQLDGDIDARIVSLSGPVAVEVVKAYEPALTQAAVNETFRLSSRPRT